MPHDSAVTRPARLRLLPALDARPRRWTKDRVASKLTRAFRELPSIEVFSPRANTFEAADPRAPTPLQLVGLTARYLAREGRDRRYLLAWARARAGGPPFAAVCRELGWNEKTARRRAERACRDLAAAFNRDSIPVTLSQAEEARLTLSEAA